MISARTMEANEYWRKECTAINEEIDLCSTNTTIFKSYCVEHIMDTDIL